VYVSDQVEISVEEAAKRAKQMHQSPPEGTVPIEEQDSAARDHEERARLLGLVDDGVGGGLDVELTDVNRSEPETARIPVQVAAAGKPWIAAYLAVHGLANPEIADLLDVGDRTVSQYISDIKSGDR
jgi:hypothetical protein